MSHESNDAGALKGEQLSIPVFSEMLGRMNHLPLLRRAAIEAHDSMGIARSISVSLFGDHWEAHVMDVYDRLIMVKAKLVVRNHSLAALEAIDE